jgi:hypothetical protein
VTDRTLTERATELAAMADERVPIRNIDGPGGGVVGVEYGYYGQSAEGFAKLAELIVELSRRVDEISADRREEQLYALRADLAAAETWEERDREEG